MRAEIEPIAGTPPRQVSLPRFSVRVTYLLIGMNLIIFALDMLLERALTIHGALVPGLVIVYGHWHRLIIAGFLHADLTHILFNLYAFLALGSLLERFAGQQRLLIVYSLSLLGCSVLVTLFSDFHTPTVGASGAIMGVLGALIVFFWHYRDLLVGGKGYLGQLGRMALINIGIGLLPGISWWGHLGGFLAGIATGWVLLPHYVQAEWLSAELKLQPLERSARLRILLLLIGQLVLLLLGFRWRG